MKAAADLGAVGIGTPPRAWAEFAGASDFRHNGQESAENKPAKTFLSSKGEEVGKEDESLGIAVAKSSATMSSRFSTFTPVSPATDRVAHAPLILSGSFEMAERLGAERFDLPASNAAQEAVEVVMRATEQLSSRDQKFVRLQFSVGDSQLDVHVELHANEIRTQFRTDSAELRQALSHEWQAVSTEIGHGARELRLAPAIFSAGSGDQSASGAFSGDTSSRQRESRASRETPASPPRAIAAISGSRTTVDAALPRGLRAAPSTSLHLHTLA
jgi:hypothetical protein